MLDVGCGRAARGVFNQHPTSKIQHLFCHWRYSTKMGYKWILFIGLPLLAAGAEHRYIVELSGDPVATHVASESKRTGKRIAMDSPVAETRRQQIRSEQ